MDRNQLSEAALDQWCPDADCQSTPLCAPCRRRFLVLVASARSASTTAQMMLHSLPGVRMSGENNNALTHIVDAMDRVRNSRAWRLQTGGAAWRHHRVHNSSFACPAQSFMETINPPTLADATRDNATILGFKTVRLLSTPAEEGQARVYNWERAAQLIRENLPCSRVVVNHRSDATSQIKSLKSTFRYSRKAVEGLAAENAALATLARELGPRQAFLLDSSVWTENVTHFNDMIAWLGFRRECAFEAAFQYNTRGGYGNGGVRGRAVPAKCSPLTS